jgi:putative MATE family efflux protein
LSSSSVQPQKQGFLETLQEALRGSEQDFTEGSLRRAIFLLAVPMVLELSMESLFAIVNIFWVASLGAAAVATVGLTEAMEVLVFAVAMGLSAGAGAFVSRRIGEKDPQGASAAAGQAVLIGLVISILIGVPAAYFAETLLGLMSNDASITKVGFGYTAVMFGGTYSIILIFLINAIFRGAGDAAIAMRVLIVANIVNLVLDPCLIFGWGPFPAMGVAGSAVATTVGRSVGVGYQLYCLFHPGSRISLTGSHLRPNVPLMRDLLAVSLPGMLQHLISTASWLALARIVAQFGAIATAGYTIAIRIIVVTILPSWGLGGAAATLMGQNLGAGKPERSERAGWLCGFYNMIFLGLVSVVFIFYSEPLVRIFTNEEPVIAVGKDALRLISYGYVLYAYGLVLVQAFNGAGDTVTPTVINIFCYWLFEIPLANYLASTAGMGPSGVFTAVTATESLIAVCGIVAFKMGRWKRVKV